MLIARVKILTGAKAHSETLEIVVFGVGHTGVRRSSQSVVIPNSFYDSSTDSKHPRSLVRSRRVEPQQDLEQGHISSPQQWSTMESRRRCGLKSPRGYALDCRLTARSILPIYIYIFRLFGFVVHVWKVRSDTIYASAVPILKCSYVVKLDFGDSAISKRRQDSRHGNTPRSLGTVSCNIS